MSVLLSFEVWVKKREFFYVITIALLFSIVFILFGVLIGSTNLKDTFVDVKWTDIISSFGAITGGFATVFAAMFAGIALKSWKKQMYVQRQITFLDDLSEAFNEYSNLIVVPIELVRISKNELMNYSLNDLDNTPFKESGLITYIRTSGQRDANSIIKNLNKCIGALNRIQALKIKGSLLGFDDYQHCISACDRITKTYSVIQAYSILINSQYLCRSKPNVVNSVCNALELDPNDLKLIVNNCNNELISYVNNKYKFSLKY